MKVEDKKLNKLNYRIAYPNNFDENKKYPVLFFFHGAGERGSNPELLAFHGPLKEIKNGKEYDFIVIAPQCDSKSLWFDHLEQVKKFVNKILKEKYIDKEKVSLTGLSMGGYMSWQLLMSMPYTFKKAVICCGGGCYWNASTIKAKVWAIHGTLDTTVFVDESIKMVNAIKAAGGDARLTIFDDLNHDCWTRTYQNDEIINWLTN